MEALQLQHAIAARAALFGSAMFKPFPSQHPLPALTPRPMMPQVKMPLTLKNPIFLIEADL